VLIAPERFPGQVNEREFVFDVTVRAKNSDGTDAKSVLEKIRIRRAPVVLIHGLWAGAESWTDDKWEGADEGMKPALEKSELFRVRTFNYDNWRGPSETMTKQEAGLAAEIVVLCKAENNDKFACTRSDIVGHSMGGLVARKFIKDNTYYRSLRSYKQGSVRRLVTLGTPHLGSGFANLLTWQDGPISNCIINFENVQILRLLLWKTVGKSADSFSDLLLFKSSSALIDLSIGSSLLNELNKDRQQIPSYALVGNTVIFPWALSSVSLLSTGCGPISLFGFDGSDGVVSIKSAKGNIPVPPNGVVISEVYGAKHTGMGTSATFVRKTIEVLNGPKDNFAPEAKNDFLSDKPTSLAKTPQTSRLENGVLASVGAVLLRLMGISTADAATPPVVTLTVDSTNPAPGASVVFSATLTGQDIKAVILTDSGSYHEGDETAPYEWTFSLANSAAGQHTFKVVAIIDGQAVESNPITVTVKPDLSALRQLTFEPGAPVTLFPGSTEQLRLLGFFNDGYKRDLTQSAMETTYSENIVDGVQITAGDSPVISISTEGKVLAQQPGTAEVIATNHGVTTTRTIHVVAFGAEDADLNNQAPVSQAGPDQTVTLGMTVVLDGSTSTDPDNSPAPLTFAWTQMAGPAVTLINDTTATPSFIPTQAGNYIFQLVVNDGKDNSAPDTVTVTVSPVNQAPIANTGPDQTIKLGATVMLDGQASVDPDQAPSPLSYQWTQTNGPTASLNGANTATPSFVPGLPGIYTFNLTVSDGLAVSPEDSVSVTVEDVPVLLLAPNGGETWKAKSVQTVRWYKSSNLVSQRKPLKIQLSKNGGKKWTTLKRANGNAGSIKWKPTRAHASDKALIRVCIAPENKKAKQVCDISDGSFVILKK